MPDNRLEPHKPKFTEPTQIQPNSPDIFYPSGSLIVRKKVVDKVKGYHTYFADTFCGDIYFNNLIAENFNLYYDPKHFYYYRLTSGSMTQTFSLYKLSKLALVEELINQRKATGTDLLEQGKMGDLETLRVKLMSNKKWKSEQYRKYAAGSIDEKQSKQATDLLKKAIQLNPFSINNYRTLAYLLKTF